MEHDISILEVRDLIMKLDKEGILHKDDFQKISESINNKCKEKR